MMLDNEFGDMEIDTVVTFSLGSPGRVSLALYDALGRHVRTLTDEMRPAGAQRLTLDGTELPRGVYALRLVTGQGVGSARVVVR